MAPSGNDSPTSDPATLGRRLAARELAAAPAALNLLESAGAATSGAAATLLAELSPAALGGEAPGTIVGLTGPPGAGKSTLLAELVARWRATARTVAVLAIDPSSKRSGGALLGDRARMRIDPSDPGVLVRSTATATRLGGLAPATREAAFALAAAYDIVVVETVGVGQSETDIAELADTVVVVVQPASGDILQFIKAGVMEIPDVLVVTKSDLGPPAVRAVRELQAALRALAADPPVLAVSSLPPAEGVEQLIAAIDQHRAGLDIATTRAASRRLAALAGFTHERGVAGLRAVGGRRGAMELLEAADPGLGQHQLTQVLEAARAANSTD